jgi:hypothetical protein
MASAQRVFSASGYPPTKMTDVADILKTDYIIEYD